ncbi:uncharacterized protein LOC124887343 isoform X2 [Capsicum annuum]|uniref:uncharacterized protein LOC124887343 isoform X2 n=1 Tax=Capsicum annuum TaxID=4072 RepID=UPI001FB0B8F3|nr:uncharacterized protein LOC124887343 isoform X2 [Capsicum annuum]
MAMAVRVRRMKEAYMLLPLISAVSFRYSTVSTISTISEAVPESLVQLNIPFFIKSTIDKPEDPSHCWLNGIPDKKSLKDGIFLVLIAGFVDSSSITEANFVSVLEKVKFLQHRYPFLQIIGFQNTKIPLHSSDICTHLFRRTLREYISFPILLSNKDVLEVCSHNLLLN